MKLRNKITAGLLCFLVSISTLARDSDGFLTVRGAIAVSTDSESKKYVFSEDDILALPQHIISTSTSWTPKSEFVGPRLSDVLSKIGANGTQVELHCLDDYVYSVSIAEASRYGAILAHTMNGKRLQINNFGPLFLVYPRDQYPTELQTPITEAKFAWQIKELVVK